MSATKVGTISINVSNTMETYTSARYKVTTAFKGLIPDLSTARIGLTMLLTSLIRGIDTTLTSVKDLTLAPTTFRTEEIRCGTRALITRLGRVTQGMLKITGRKTLSARKILGADRVQQTSDLWHFKVYLLIGILNAFTLMLRFLHHEPSRPFSFLIRPKLLGCSSHADILC